MGRWSRGNYTAHRGRRYHLDSRGKQHHQRPLQSRGGAVHERLRQMGRRKIRNHAARHQRRDDVVRSGSDLVELGRPRYGLHGSARRRLQFRGYGAGIYGTVVYTEDLGQTWTEIGDFDMANNLESISFADPDHGWATVIDDVSPFIAHTENGGYNWTEQLRDMEYYRSICFVNDDIGWAVGNGGAMVRTVDGGENWDPIESGTSSSLFSVWFLDENVGYAVGASGTIIRTTDGGDTWTSQESGTQNALMSVHFIDASQGWVVGDRGTILHTSDGGEGLATNEYWRSDWRMMVSSTP